MSGDDPQGSKGQAVNGVAFIQSDNDTDTAIKASVLLDISIHYILHLFL